MDINIRLEIAPSPELVTLINALLLFNHPNPTFVSATKSEVAKNVELAEKKAEEEKKGPDTSKKSKVHIMQGITPEEGGSVPPEEVKTSKKKNQDVTLESLKALATTLKTETEFDVKAWLKQRGCARMADLKEDDYSDCFNDLMKIAGENNVQTF